MKNKAWWQQARDLKKIIREELDRLEEIQTKATHRTQILTGMPSAHGGNRSMDAAIEYVDTESTIKAEAEAFEQLKAERYAEAMSITNPKLREIMIRRYVNCESWKHIRKSMHISESSMFEHHAAYFKENK